MPPPSTVLFELLAGVESDGTLRASLLLVFLASREGLVSSSLVVLLSRVGAGQPDAADLAVDSSGLLNLPCASPILIVKDDATACFALCGGNCAHALLDGGSEALSQRRAWLRKPPSQLGAAPRGCA